MPAWTVSFFKTNHQGYLTKLVSNEAVKPYIGRHAPEILEHFELIVNTVSMEEALQQKKAEEAANGTAGQDANASIAAYVAETMGSGEETERKSVIEFHVHFENADVRADNSTVQADVWLTRAVHHKMRPHLLQCRPTNQQNGPESQKIAQDPHKIT